MAEDDLNKPRTLKKWQGKYWLAYHTYPGEGYEVGPARFGLAWTEDESLMTWNRLPEPILPLEDGAEWERGGLYKYCLLRHGDLFHIFYNAKNTDHPNPWIEQTGHATSPDLKSWTRSDPFVVRYGNRWVMFHFGFDGRHAQDGIAFSDDLYHWRQLPDPILTVGADGEIDSIHAHKPGIIRHDGVLYHFYCACRPWREGDPAKNLGNEFRCLTVATSKPV